MTFREDLAENVCALESLWKALLGLEVLFLVLLAGAAAFAPGGQSRTALLALNLVVIVPTTIGLIVVLRWCGLREMRSDPVGEADGRD